VFQLLMPHVIRDLRQLLESYRSQVIARVPSQRLVARMAVAVGESRACALEPLDESWNVECGRELEQQMDVIRDDSDLDHPRVVAFDLGEEKRREEVGHWLIDQWQSRPAGPGEVGVDAYGHALKTVRWDRATITKGAHHGVF